MSKNGYLILGVVVLSLLFLASSLVMGDDISGKLSRVIRLELGLDSNLYRVVETKYRGETVILIVIFGNEQALNSSLGSDIKTAIRQNMDETPLAISVLTRNKQAKFDPYALRIVQNNEEASPKNVIGITEGFNEGAMPEKVPIEGEEFWGSKGVVTMGEDFDTSSSFSVKYGTSSASFSLSGQDTGMETVDQGTDKSTDEELGETSSGLEGEGESSQDTDKSTNETRNEELGETSSGLEGEGESSQTDTNPSSSSHNSRTGTGGGGLALLVQLAALLAVTFSFL